MGATIPDVQCPACGGAALENLNNRWWWCPLCKEMVRTHMFEALLSYTCKSEDHARILAAKDARIAELEDLHRASRALLQRWFASTVKSHMPYIQLLRADTVDWLREIPQPALTPRAESEVGGE